MEVSSYVYEGAPVVLPNHADIDMDYVMKRLKDERPWWTKSNPPLDAKIAVEIDGKIYITCLNSYPIHPTIELYLQRFWEQVFDFKNYSWKIL